MRIAVVGAGIVGGAIAHALLDEGHEVEILEREAPSSGASAGNAGWIAHLDILPLAGPKAWANMPRWMLDPYGPLSIAPTYLPRLAPYLLQFVLASRPSRIESSTLAIRALNAGALPAWERRLGALGRLDRLRRRGLLSVWTDAGDFAGAAKLHARQRTMGIEVETLDAGAVRRLEPAFGAAVVGGALYPAGLNVDDPRRFTEDLVAAAVERGATLTVATVTGLESSAAGIDLRAATHGLGRFDRVVIAAGAWSKSLARAAGDRIPLDTERGYNITVAPGALGLSRPVMYEGHGFVTSPLDTGDRIGGGVEFAGLTAPQNDARIDAMLKRLGRVLPEFRVGEGIKWMGHRPSSPDSLPIIGPASDDDRVIHAFGHGHYGLTQGAVTAEIVAALIAGRTPPIDIAPYAASRF
ncbi:FAD-binding oxidoreductase [Siculibacillus lacustris]|uniref:FAD-binding oxidoreductase n=1 Tax=Siculibacillus lacustris TaxID=1549641 RepID=A0A4V2KUD2_9HYPH|nr:FAD-binding oxidoreductase [Siculibacillus lacustris]TBW41036.1 FAD-binding oxidoreductase [Siculibacillus lacustris]